MIRLGIKSFVIIVLWYRCLWINRSSCPKVFCKNGVLRNFAKFTGKHLYQLSYKRDCGTGVFM